LIRIRDVNDHIPQFSRPSYQVCNGPMFSRCCCFYCCRIEFLFSLSFFFCVSCSNV
jgi:hypothetical protein